MEKENQKEHHLFFVFCEETHLLFDELGMKNNGRNEIEVENREEREEREEEDINFNNYMLKNNLIIIRNIKTEEWPITSYFLTTTTTTIELNEVERRKYHPIPFLNHCGNEIISIHNKGMIEKMKINEFMNQINRGESLYAKDWHIFQYYSNQRIYTIPEPFIDDWLNWYWKYCKNNEDDYRFVYIGGENTKTDLHHDVLYSYSWSINLYGKKRWTIWPPNEISKLQQLRELSSRDDEGNDDNIKKDLIISQSNPIIIDQDINEAIFIPSGWYHIVENLNTSLLQEEPNITISLNHNWFNCYSLHLNWLYLLNQHHLVCCEIQIFHPTSTSSASSSVNISSSFPSSSNDSMCMSLFEWFHHSQYLLSLQAGMNLLEFICLISLRHYILLLVHQKEKNKNNCEDKNQPCQLIRTLFKQNYKLSTSSIEIIENEFNEEIFEKDFNNFLEYNELDERVYHQLSHHIFSLEDIPQQSFPIDHPLYNSFVRIIDTIRQEYFIDYCLKSHHQYLNKVSEGKEEEEKEKKNCLNGWIYCQLQVKSILKSVLSLIRQKEDDIYQIICHEIKLNEKQLEEAITEYLQLIDSQLE